MSLKTPEKLTHTRIFKNRQKIKRDKLSIEHKEQHKTERTWFQTIFKFRIFSFRIRFSFMTTT